MKKWIAICLLLCMILSLCACAEEETAVFVQPVSRLMNLGGIAPGDRFAGIVVSENVTEVEKDNSMTVEELLVKEGDDVTEGQALFTYETRQLKLSLDKQKLELQQLEATIDNYEDQISDLKKERKKAKESDKLEYTIQIQSIQVDLQEAKINLSAKRESLEQAQQILKNATVSAPVSGRIQAISENGTDDMGNPQPYITIRQSGSFRVKGTVGELQLSAITEGTRMQIFSRTDESLSWAGSVSMIDFESPSQSNPNEMYYGNSSEEMTSTSKYPFYVTLDSTEGLLLGQHVYLQPEGMENLPTGPSIGAAFLCFADDGSAYVWAEKSGKLEKRTLTLGEYNPMNDTYAITSGLSESDYIAYPDEFCREGAPTTRAEPAQTAESGVK